MKKYRKKPLVIEAVQWDGIKLEGRYPIEFFKEHDVEWHYGKYLQKGMHELFIHTLEGEMIVSIGDYVIKGIKNEFYPCKPDVFEASYEEVSE